MSSNSYRKDRFLSCLVIGMLGASAGCSDPCARIDKDAPASQRFRLWTTSDQLLAPIAAGGAEVAFAYRPSSGEPQWCDGAQERRATPFTQANTLAVAVLSVLGVEDEEIRTRSGTPGTTKLELKDGQGEVVDSFDIVVKPTTTIELLPVKSTLLLEGGTAEQCIQLYSGNERVLGSGALRYSFTGQLRLDEAAVKLRGPSAAGRANECVYFSGSLGKGAVSASSVEGVNAALDWTVVSPAEVANIQLTAKDSFGTSVELTANALSPGGQLIYGPKCTWSADQPGATFQPPLAPFYSPESDVIAASFSQPGTYALTCSIGAARGRTVVKWNGSYVTLIP